MVRTREREGSDEGEQRIVTGGPEHCRACNLHVLSRENIVRPEVAGSTAERRGRETVKEVCGIEGWVTEMQRVCVCL